MKSSMKKLTTALVLAVFFFNCWLAWAMLALLLDVRHAGRVLPYFTNLCISLRPLLVVLPLVAGAYGLWLWFRKPENVPEWTRFILTTMTVLILFVFPPTLTSCLIFIDLMRSLAMR
jgi:hypothetical protein